MKLIIVIVFLKLIVCFVFVGVVLAVMFNGVLEILKLILSFKNGHFWILGFVAGLGLVGISAGLLRFKNKRSKQ